MPSLKITKRAIDALPTPVGKDQYYWDNAQEGPPGFGVRVTPKGVKSFVYQYRLKGRAARRITIGRYGKLTAEQARIIAKGHSFSVAGGSDPLEVARKKARDARNLAFDAYVERFADAYLKEEWPDSWQDAKRRLEMHVVPYLGSRPLTEIAATDIGAIIDRLRPQKALARNTDAVLRVLFNWAAEPERADLPSSPMAGMKRPPKPDPRTRTLKPDELVACWRASYKLAPPFGPFVRLLMLTLQRRNEVARLPWKELNQKEALWQIEGDRAKNDEPHLVHLNALAVSELATLGWKRRGLVFSTTGETPISGFSKMKLALDAAMLPIVQELADKRAEERGEEPHPVEMKPWTLHDIRRTGTTTLQALGFPIEVTERVINHKSGEVSGIKAVYNLWEYWPERQDALTKWGAYLDGLIKGADASNVIALAERRAR